MEMGTMRLVKYGDVEDALLCWAGYTTVIVERAVK